MMDSFGSRTRFLFETKEDSKVDVAMSVLLEHMETSDGNDDNKNDDNIFKRISCS